jgi:hypothetical protein
VRFGLRLARRVLAQTSPVGIGGWDHREVERGTCERHIPVLRIHRAMLRRCCEDGSAGVYDPPIMLHHCAVVLAVPPAS